MINLDLLFHQGDRFYLALQEKGTQFSEEIDVDEKQDVEIFRVPDHNDVEGADFYHDFKKVIVTGFKVFNIVHWKVIAKPSNNKTLEKAM